MGDFIAIRGDLCGDGAAVLGVKVPDLFSQHAGKKGLSESFGHADGGHCHQDIGNVDDDETGNEKIDEIQDQRIHLVLESGRGDGASGEVAELGGEGAKDNGHQGHSGA